MDAIGDILAGVVQKSLQNRELWKTTSTTKVFCAVASVTTESKWT